VTVFTKNRDRLLAGEIAEGFFQAVLTEAREAGLLSDEHFRVDATLIEADPARGAEPPEPSQRDRRPDHDPRGLRDQPA
jgi:isocitrate dehydrogenase kinase/phosphatase